MSLPKHHKTAIEGFVDTIQRFMGQGKLMYTFSAERHRLSAFRPPRLLVPRKRNSGKQKVIAESGKCVLWFTRTQDL